MRKPAWLGLALAAGWLTGAVPALAAPQVVQVSAGQLWRRAEFQILGIPAAANPFDPDVIRVDGEFTLPSGRTMTVPAFWFQGYSRALNGTTETLTPYGAPEWRLRFTPPETGVVSLAITIRTNGLLAGSPTLTNFSVATGPALARWGYARVAAGNQYFETGDGQALRLIGENVCWYGSRGTFDYDDWFAAMQAAGENHARLWMCPWAFGLETGRNSRTNYALDAAWKLDYVLRLAEARGIYVLLCLDYHGMLEITPDYWGGNNYWTNNPYNLLNGGPCANQDGFFTNTTAQTIYQKRLRYLVGRYGYSPNLLAWQFWNEIDNVYQYLVPTDVAAWHGLMGDWLHANDPFGHLVTTSLTGSSDRPEIWTVPQLDFANYHSYGEPGPAGRLAAVAQSFLRRYGKPVLIDEFGTDWRGWAQANDPYLRGFRQGLWGGALGGSVGTAMSWWWENIHSENLYPLYSALGSVLNRTGWGRGSWTNISFQTTGAPPLVVGDPIPGGVPFNVTLPLSGVWGGMTSGEVAVADANAGAYSAVNLNSFVQGTSHPDLRTPFRLSAWLTNNARLVMHLNSVSWYSTLLVKADGSELYRTNLPNLDGYWSVTNEYNMDIAVPLPAGKRLIEITNAGQDWFYLDWVRLEQVMPSTYPANWQPSPDAIGLRGPRESLVYVIAPGAVFPANATNTTLPLQQSQAVVLTNWPAGTFAAEWYDPATGVKAGFTQAATAGGTLTLPLPDFREDLAGIVYPPPRLTALPPLIPGQFQFRLDSETGGQYQIQSSTDFVAWSDALTVSNSSGATNLSVPISSSSGFLRAEHAP